MFGLPSQVQLANYLVGNYRQRQYFLYVQDDFRVNSKLTLNLGLRWEYATPRWERDNVLSNFDPATNSHVDAPKAAAASTTARWSIPTIRTGHRASGWPTASIRKPSCGADTASATCT